MTCTILTIDYYIQHDEYNNFTTTKQNRKTAKSNCVIVCEMESTKSVLDMAQLYYVAVPKVLFVVFNFSFIFVTPSTIVVTYSYLMLDY